MHRSSGLTAVVAVFVLALAACGSQPTDAKPSAETTSQPPAASQLVCEGEGCRYDNMEIKTTPCQEPAVDASEERVSAEPLGIKADVVVRKSAASGAGCDRLYWGKLDMSRFPGDPNEQPYVLSLTVTSEADGSHTVAPQESDDPKNEALTRTIKVSDAMREQGLTVTACVAAGGSVDQVCAKAKVV